MIVHLAQVEVSLVCHVGVLRQRIALAEHQTHRNGKPNSARDFGDHIHGAAAEYAVVKVLGRGWRGILNLPNEDDPPDADYGLQVRHTEHDHGCLILRDEDSPDTRWVLVVGSLPHLRIVGSIIGRDGMIERHRTNFGHPERPSVYGVPQAALDPVADRNRRRRPVIVGDLLTGAQWRLFAVILLVILVVLVFWRPR